MSVTGGEDFLPVVFHADDGPAFGGGFVQGLVEFADWGVAVVGVLAHGVGMVDEEHETRAGAGGGPLEHLLIAVGVSEGGDGTLADEGVDTDGLARAVVDEADLWEAHDDGCSVLSFKLGLHGCADDLVGRDAVSFVGPGAHESDFAAGDDEGLEAVGAEVGEEFDHRLIDELRVGVVEFFVVGLG